MNTPLSQLIVGQQLTTLHPNDTVHDCLEKLAATNITSAPFLDSNGVLLGFVDILDILAFLVKVATKPLADSNVGESSSLKSDDVLMLARRTKDFNLHSVTHLIDHSQRNLLITLSGDATIENAIRKFNEFKVHRVAILEGQKLIGVVSQFDVLKWLLSNQKAWKSNKDIEECSPQKLMMVEEDTRAIDAFLTMHRDKLSSVAIIDKEQHLVGVLTASDLKSMRGENFQRLLEPVKKFVNNSHQQIGKGDNYLVTCPAQTKLNEACNRIFTESVHRIFIVDKEKKPTGVVSLSDMMIEMC